MKRSTLFSVLLTLVCAAALWGVFAQRRQLADLRAEQQQLLADASAEASHPASATPVTGVSSNSLELLRLRSEVTQLGQRKQALAGVTNENERLRAQLESARTNRANPAGGAVLPADYVRTSQAEFKGYATPEDTLQSLTWALRNRDFTNLLQAFTPEIQTKLLESGQSQEQLLQAAKEHPGFRVTGREQAPDGSVTLQVEDVPGTPATSVRFRSIGGQWKLDEE